MSSYQTGTPGAPTADADAASPSFKLTLKASALDQRIASDEATAKAHMSDFKHELQSVFPLLPPEKRVVLQEKLETSYKSLGDWTEGLGEQKVVQDLLQERVEEKQRAQPTESEDFFESFSSNLFSPRNGRRPSQWTHSTPGGAATGAATHPGASNPTRLGTPGMPGRSRSANPVRQGRRAPCDSVTTLFRAMQVDDEANDVPSTVSYDKNDFDDMSVSYSMASLPVGKPLVTYAVANLEQIRIDQQLLTPRDVDKLRHGQATKVLRDFHSKGLAQNTSVFFAFQGEDVIKVSGDVADTAHQVVSF